MTDKEKLKKLMAVVEECVDYKDHLEYPGEGICRWRDCGCGGPLTEKLVNTLLEIKCLLTAE